MRRKRKLLRCGGHRNTNDGDLALAAGLLQAGAKPTIVGSCTPLHFQQLYFPRRRALIASNKLRRLRRPRSLSRPAAVSSLPTTTQKCTAQPLPRVTLAPLVDGQNDEVEQEGRTLRKTLAFLTGMGGGGMPRDVLRIVIDLISPSWDPLRRAGPGGGEQHTNLKITSSSISSSTTTRVSKKCHVKGGVL